jgi:signal transduction histidine kinase
VLHDIGNALVGVGSYLTRIKQSAEFNDIGTIENLRRFIEKNLQSLTTVFGQKKANALLDLLSGLIASQKDRLAEIKNSVSDQLKIVSHINEILNIQRQYVKGQNGERLPVNIRSVMDDAVSMLFGAMDKKGITYHFDAPVALPDIKGDRTKLMQVFLNLLKNAIESMTVAGHTNEEKAIFSSVTNNGTMITVQIKDTGNGFDAETASMLFTRGYTTKTEGTGLGLANCKSIIEGHNGEMTIISDGIGKGATASIVFQL